MRRNENSPLPGFLSMSAPVVEPHEPLLGYVPDDPRKTECEHGWNDGWGKGGERQHLCSHCKRWIWEHSITARPISGDSGPS